MVRGGRCGPGVAHQTLVPLLGGPSGTRMGGGLVACAAPKKHM